MNDSQIDALDAVLTALADTPLADRLVVLAEAISATQEEERMIAHYEAEDADELSALEYYGYV
jgi:hypothetical protein